MCVTHFYHNFLSMKTNEHLDDDDDDDNEVIDDDDDDDSDDSDDDDADDDDDDDSHLLLHSPALLFHSCFALLLIDRVVAENSPSLSSY